jgi:hypothetical protein
MSGRPRLCWRAAGTLVFLAAVTMGALAGCGSSSKPAYCGERTNLQNSVKELPSAVTSGGLSSLKSQLSTIQSQASSVVDSAKQDFPSESSAVSTAVSALQQSVQALPSSPSAADLVSVGKDAAGLVTAVNNFVDATNSKCS